jgi:hypothetical protein
MMLANNRNRKFGTASNAKNRRVVSNAQIMGKIKRALDIRLPRPGGMAAALEKDGLAVAEVKKKMHVA